MSDIQQYPGSGAPGGGRAGMGFQHEQMHERREPLHHRYRPFLGPYVLTLIVFPIMEWIGYGIREHDLNIGLEIIFCWLFLGWSIALLVSCIGLYVSKRTTFLVAHITACAWLLCNIAAFTTLIGFPPWWDVPHVFLSGLIATSIMLYRSDSLRSMGAQTVRDGWGQAIGMIRSTPRVRITDDGAHAIIQVRHGPGEDAGTVRSAAPKLESAVNAVAGRTTVTPLEDGRAGGSEISLALKDTLKDPVAHPGPSHPGWSFAYPLRTGLYETSNPKDPRTHQWFALVGANVRSPLTSFRSTMDTHLGLTGVTGSGKSGSLNNLAMEILTRFDAHLVWLDRAKFRQNAGWCAQWLTMGADNNNAEALINALRAWADYRVDLFGQVSLDAQFTDDDWDDDSADTSDLGRKWSPELAVETGEGAVGVIVDEADIALKSKKWDWMFTRGRSLGFYLIPAIPRASSAELNPLIRSAIGAWKTFSIGDDYSEQFTLSSETREAGADPGKLRDWGMHYLDRAPGVDKKLWPVVAREFESSPKQLRRFIAAARETFDPMPVSEGAKAAMGAAFTACDPRRMLVPRALDLPDNPEPVTAGVPPQSTAHMTPADRRAAPDGDDWDDEEEEEEGTMKPTARGTVVEDDKVAPIDHRQLYREAAEDGDDTLAQEIASHPDNPDEDELPPLPDDQIFEYPNRKPTWTHQEREAEIDRVIIHFASIGKRTFSNKEFMDEMRCYLDPASTSRRLHAMSDDPPRRIMPQGYALEDTDHSTWTIVRTGPSPRPHRSQEV